ncbi:MAG: HNH endonuclease [Caldisericia bacterium]
MSEVLVLNRNFYAIHVAHWQHAMSLLFKEHAYVIDNDFQKWNFSEWVELSKMMDNHPAGYIHTVSLKIAIPEVIALSLYDELPVTDVKFTRKNIYRHYAHKCCYCGNKFGTEDLNLDHVLPSSRGGETNWANIVLSCIPCNTKKGSHTPAEAGLKMFYQPSKPAWHPSYCLGIKTHINICESWKKFINKIYWDGELER